MGDAIREELELLWRGRVADAKLRHDLARKFLKEIREAYPSDDSPECAKATFAESAAKADYLLVLQLFNALVTDGKIPDESRWRKCAAA